MCFIFVMKKERNWPHLPTKLLVSQSSTFEPLEKRSYVQKWLLIFNSKCIFFKVPQIKAKSTLKSHLNCFISNPLWWENQTNYVTVHICKNALCLNIYSSKFLHEWIVKLQQVLAGYAKSKSSERGCMIILIKHFCKYNTGSNLIINIQIALTVTPSLHNIRWVHGANQEWMIRIIKLYKYWTMNDKGNNICNNI